MIGNKMWFFNKKNNLNNSKSEGPKEIARWLIPVENLEEIYSLHWDMIRDKGQNLLAVYKFWSAIRRLVPPELKKNYRLVFETTLCSLECYVVAYEETHE